MKRERRNNAPCTPWPELVKVSIYCVWYEHDREWEVTRAEADRIVNSFLYDKFVKIDVDWDINYINVHNIISIEVE